MDPHILVQEFNSTRSQGGVKARREVKRCFLFVLLLSGLSQGAGQGNLGDTVTGGCSWKYPPKKLMQRTTVEKDGQQEVNISEKTQHEDLLRTIREVNPITRDRRCESAQLSPQAAKVRSTPELKEQWMEESLSRFSSEEVTQKRGNLEMRQSFGEAHRLMNVVKRGESVCKIVVGDSRFGTGFVLFDSLVLTNAHLFTGHMDEDNLQLDVKVLVIFNYDGTNQDTLYFTAKKALIDFEDTKDYAVLELNSDGQRLFRINETEKIKPPAGLLRYFGSVPTSGKASIIGHPGGGMKMMDSTYIIEKEERIQAIDDHLRQYKDAPYTVHTITERLTAQGIKHVLPGGVLADRTATYKASMSHGSSGSPVFDANGRVFGLHSYLFHHDVGDQPRIVMAVALPLDGMFMQFLTNLEATDNYELLSRVEEEVEGNTYLKILMNLTVHSKYSYSKDLEESEESAET